MNSQPWFPDKWCIRQNLSQDVCDYINKVYNKNSSVNGNFTENYGIH